MGYVCEDEGRILAVFMFSTEPDPTYAEIYDGAWLSDAPYGVIHRIAVAEQGRGIMDFCVNFCAEKCESLRIDTHRDNAPMRRALEKRGFRYCGIIYLESGDERLAYQRIPE